jgi:hypothetical protein
MLYFFKNVKLTECRTYGHARYKSRTSRGRTFITHRKLRYFIIIPRLQMLFISPYTIEYITWHHLYDAVNEWWYTISMVKHINILIWCILSFLWNQRACVLCYIRTNSIYLGNLLLFILVIWWYAQFTICHLGCVWGWSSCFYLQSYSILIVWVGI